MNIFDLIFRSSKKSKGFKLEERKMIKDKIDKVLKNYSDRESMKNGNDFVEYFETFELLKENFNET
ncbi:MAG: hypothetical protein RR338_01960, partial [Clostridia bacterium]